MEAMFNTLVCPSGASLYTYMRSYRGIQMLLGWDGAGLGVYWLGWWLTTFPSGPFATSSSLARHLLIGLSAYVILRLHFC